MKRLWLKCAAALLCAVLFLAGAAVQPVSAIGTAVTETKDNHWNVLGLIYKNVKTKDFSQSFSDEEVTELKRVLKEYPAMVKNLSDSRMLIDRVDTYVIEDPVRSVSGSEGDLAPGGDINIDTYLEGKDYQLIIVYAPVTGGPNFSGWLGLGGTWYTYKDRDIYYLTIDMVLDIGQKPYSIRGGSYDSDMACLLHETLHCVETNSSINGWDGFTPVHDNGEHGYVSEEKYGWLDWYSALMRDDGLGGKGFKPQSFFVKHYDPAAEAARTKLLGEADKLEAKSGGAIQSTGIFASTENGSIPGVVIGAGGSWLGGINRYEEAWDGRGDSFYDPHEQGPTCWTGIVADQPYSISEVRILPRIDFFDRTAGAMVQGSNDGVNWTTLAYFTSADCLRTGAKQTYITKAVTVTDAFTMFRYINDGTSHGDVANVVLIPGTGKKTVIPGQVIGQVLATDIRAYINGAEIPAYNIDGKLAILVSDLNNYGFKTSFDNNLRKTTVTRDRSKTKFTSVPSKATGLKVGTPVMSVLSTDIVVELNGAEVQAFNVDDRMAIYLTELKAYGDVVYDNAARASRVTLK